MKRPLCLVCVAFVFALLMLTSAFPISLYEDMVEDGTVVEQIGQVYKKEYKNDTLVLYIQSETDQFLCYVNDGQAPRLGSYIKVRGRYQSFKEASNPGQFHQKRYYQILNLNFSLRNAVIVEESNEYSVLQESLYSIKTIWAESYDKALPEKEAGILKAMVLGYKGELDTDIKTLYTQSGISHVLAISGLHISLIGMGIYKLLAKTGMPVLALTGFSMGVMFFYGMIIGGGTSCFRAIFMFSIYLIGKWIGRTYDMLTATSLAGVFLLITQPLYLYHTGCLLSFFAVTGIALLTPVFEELFSEKIKKNPIIKNLVGSLSVSFFTLPVLTYYFYEFPIYSFFLNLLIIPLMSVLLPLALVGGILGIFLPAAGVIVLTPCKWILMFYEGVCEIFTKLPYNTFVTGQPAVWQIVLFFAVVLCVVLFYKKWKKAKTVSLLILAVFMLCVQIHPKTEITMLDVGQGDCIFIKSEDGATFLMDGGSSDVSKVGTYRIIPFLKSKGVREITYAFVSHPDSDHYNGILECLEKSPENGISIKYLAVSHLAFKGQDEAYEKLFRAAENAGTKVVCISAGDMLKCKKITLICLYPEKDSSPTDTNGESLVFLMESEGVRMLFTADAGVEEEAAIISRLCDVDILKAGHHGSNGSTGETLLQTIKPEITIISCGENNSYGHPGKEMLKRLAEANSREYVTAESGAIQITINSNGFQVETYCK